MPDLLRIATSRLPASIARRDKKKENQSANGDSRSLLNIIRGRYDGKIEKMTEIVVKIMKPQYAVNS